MNIFTNASGWISFSLKRFFLTSLFGLLSVSIFMSIFIHRQVTIEQIDELFDAQMAQRSRMLQGFLQRPIDELDYDKLNSTLLTALHEYADDEPHPTGHNYENKLAVQLWDAEGNLLVKTPSAPMYLLSPLEAGYSFGHYQKHKWHTFSQYMPKSDLWIVLAERDDIREELIDESLWSTLTGLFFAGLLMSIFLVWVIKRGLQPLNFISQQLAERNLDKLTSIQLEESIPVELIPVTTSINQLLTRVSNAIEIERRFLGDVAHELRTPLSALKLQTQIALQNPSPERIKQQLEKILSGINRSNRLIQQLLTLARLDPKALGDKQSVNLFDVLIQTLQDTDVNFQHPGEYSHEINLFNHQLLFEDELRHCWITAHPILLNVLLRNLIDNACRYSPAGSVIQLGLTNHSQYIELTITDSGPGIAADKLSSLGKRFFRNDTTQISADQSGSGLGLSIVARIVELHQGQLEFLSSHPQGLKVSIKLPKNLRNKVTE